MEEEGGGPPIVCLQPFTQPALLAIGPQVHSLPDNESFAGLMGVTTDQREFGRGWGA